MTIGIYGIKNKINTKIYIGQSVNIENRWERHRQRLNRNKHYNNHLQKAYRKYGANNFDFIILEECAVSELDGKEQTWIDQSERVYNQEKNIVDRSGTRNFFFGKRHTEETKRRMSKKKRGVYLGENNPNYGNKQPLSTRLKMVKNNKRTKLTEKDVLIIIDLLKKGESHQNIANQFNISRTVITRISNGTRWTNVTGGPVVPVIYSKGVRQFSTLHRKRIGEKRKGQKHTEESKTKMSLKKRSKYG